MLSFDMLRGLKLSGIMPSVIKLSANILLHVVNTSSILIQNVIILLVIKLSGLYLRVVTPSGIIMSVIIV
jgi:hypothetical protein